MNPYKSLEDTIKDSNLPSLSKDYLEIAIDGVLDDGILKDIPLVGSVVGGIKFGNSLQQHFAAKKIYKFLYEIHNVPQEMRIKKIDEINNSKKYRSSVGEMIFELLDKIESDGKPEIIGKMFTAVIEEKINYSTYLKCAHIVKNIFFYDLVNLKIQDGNNEIITTIGDGLLDSGLIKIGTKGESETRLSELGDIIINIGMKN